MPSDRPKVVDRKTGKRDVKKTARLWTNNTVSAALEGLSDSEVETLGKANVPRELKADARRAQKVRKARRKRNPFQGVGK